MAQPTYPERIERLQRVAAFDYSKELNLHRNEMNRGLFTYARHSVQLRPSYDLPSYSKVASGSPVRCQDEDTVMLAAVLEGPQDVPGEAIRPTSAHSRMEE